MRFSYKSKITTNVRGRSFWFRRSERVCSHVSCVIAAMLADRRCKIRLSPIQRRPFNEARHPERYSDAPLSRMDADDSRARSDRYFLLHLRRDQAVGAGSVQYDGADPGSVAHPVSARECAL